MGYPPRSLRRQANALGGNGQFDYVAASGSTAPSVISAINESMRENAANNKIAEDAANVQWRRENAEAVYDTLNQLDPNSDDFADQLGSLDARARQLPGVKDKIKSLQDRNDEYKGAVAAALQEEDAKWDKLLTDATAYGTRDEINNIQKMREEGLDYEAAYKFADGEDAFYRRRENALQSKADEEAYIKAEGAATKVYDRTTSTLDRTYKRKLQKRDKLEKQLSDAESRLQAAQDTLGDEGAEKQKRATTTITALQKKLGEVEKELSPYYEGVSKAEEDLAAFYNPELKKENILNELNREEAENAVQNILND